MIFRIRFALEQCFGMALGFRWRYIDIYFCMLVVGNSCSHQHKHNLHLPANTHTYTRPTHTDTRATHTHAHKTVGNALAIKGGRRRRLEKPVELWTRCGGGLGSQKKCANILRACLARFENLNFTGF